MLRRFLTMLLFLLSAVGADAQVTAIRAGKLVDPESGTTSLNQVILVEGRTIRAVGAEVTIPAGAKLIDLSSMTVMPGLIDCHTHVCSGVFSRRGIPRKAARSGQLSYDLGNTTAYRAIQGVANARTMLESGFTTIRDIGNAGNYADVDLRRAITEGLVPGPTMITAGRIIAPFGGQYAPSDRGYALNPERPGLGAPEYLFADTHDELRKAIRENIFYGAQVIKIVVDDQRYIYSVDDIRFAVEEAHRAGVKLAAHCVTEAGARNAATAGVDSIEHGFMMSDSVLELAKQNKVVLVGTDFTKEYLQEYGQEAETAGRGYARSLDRIRRAYRIGVEQAFGSDIIFDVDGRTRGEVCLSILDTYIAAGLPNDYLLRMLTTNAARLLDVSNRRGAIRAGLAADIIATAESPLDQIQTLKRVRFVMREGVVYRQ
ncbi:MAG: amidohydrolase family protein [Acidobacteria bacterium]|nr:amidohydrolase family protein [Acidobacteriota bacterium]